MVQRRPIHHVRHRKWAVLAMFALITASVSGSVWMRSANTQAATVLPAKLAAGFWQMWEGPRVSEITASAPQYNLFFAAFAMGSNSSGNVDFSPVFSSGAELKGDIAASKAAGNTWLVSVGGGSDSTIRLLTETHATNMFNSLVGIVDAYGFQGIDLDIECGSSCFSPTAAASLAHKLKVKYGSSFVVSASPRPYETRSASAIYTDFALKAGNDLDLFGMQFYDFPETRNTSQLTSIINNDLATVTSLGIPASKILIGCITYSQYGGGWNTVDVYKTIYQQQVAKYPSLRGMFIWETSLDKKESWSFAKTIGPAVGATHNVPAPAPTPTPIAVTTTKNGVTGTTSKSTAAAGATPTTTTSTDASPTPDAGAYPVSPGRAVSGGFTGTNFPLPSTTKAAPVSTKSRSNIALIILIIAGVLATVSTGAYFGWHKYLLNRGAIKPASSDKLNPFKG